MTRLSKLISGTMTWGEWGKNLSSSQMISLIEQVYDAGINTFDHADIYGGYTTEETFGNAFKNCGIKRENLFFISKCGIQYKCEKRPLKVKHYDYRKEYIIESVENSLRFLHTDYLDVILLHRPSPLMDIDEILEAITLLSKQGKIKHFGVSNFTPVQMELIQKEIPIEWNQMECSLTNSEAMFDGTLDKMQASNIQAMAWNPLGSYFKESNEQNTRLKKALSELCEKYKTSENNLLIAWLLNHPSNIHPVIGTTQIDRIKELQKSVAINLSLEDWFYLLEISRGHKVA